MDLPSIYYEYSPRLNRREEPLQALLLLRVFRVRDWGIDTQYCRYAYGVDEGLGYRVRDAGFVREGSGFGVRGSGFRVSGLGFLGTDAINWHSGLRRRNTSKIWKVVTNRPEKGTFMNNGF